MKDNFELRKMLEGVEDPRDAEVHAKELGKFLSLSREKRMPAPMRLTAENKIRARLHSIQAANKVPEDKIEAIRNAIGIKKDAE